MNALINPYLTDAGHRERIYRILCQFLLVFYVPLLTRPANYIWVALLVFWITEPQLKSKLKAAFRDRTFQVVIALYAMHAISLFYSYDLYEAIKRLETRVALVVFPFVFGTIALSSQTVRALLKTFVWVCFAVGLAGLINSIWLYLETSESVYLYSDNLLLLIDGQAIYFALYLNAALLFCLYLLYEKALKLRERYAFIYLLIPFFTIMIFLLAGRVSLAILALLFGIVVIILIVRRRMYLLGGVILVGTIVASVLMGVFFPKTVNRFKALANVEFDYETPAAYHFNEENFENKWNGLTIRLALWTCTWDLFKEQPVFGTGIGDFMDDLREVYRERKFHLAIDQDLSPHNQYLQILLTLGVVGFVVFLVYLVYPAIRARRQGNYLFLFFLLIIALNMLTEEVFAVYRGVVFFSFFHSLLLFQPGRYPRDTF